MKGYTLDKGTVKWAKQRWKELDDSNTETGLALELLEKVPGLLMAAADKMDNQPESEIVRSFASDIENMKVSLNMCFLAWISDKNRLRTAIRKYEEGENGNA